MSSATGRPWDGIELWGSHKQFRGTLDAAEEADFDDYLDGARQEDLARRRAEIEEDFPDLDLEAPIPDDLFHTLPEEDLDRLIDWQYDKDSLDDEREREASAKEFAETMAEVGDAEPPPRDEEPPVLGPRRPLTAQQRFEIGFRTKGLVTPEMREWEIAADRALSEQFGQHVVGQWVFGMSDPLMVGPGEEMPEGAEVIGPAYEDEPELGTMVRIPTARRKYRIAGDGTFLGQFAYDDREAASLLYVTFYQNAGTANIPVSYGVLVDVSTDRIFNVGTSRAPKDVMDAVRADNDGGLYIDGLLDQPDPRWLAAEPKTLDESMDLMADRLAPKGVVAEWVNDPDHVLNPAARRYRRNLFPPVEAERPIADEPAPAPGAPADAPVGDDAAKTSADDASTVDEVFGPPPQHLQDLDDIPDGTPPEVHWGDGESPFSDGRDDSDGVNDTAPPESEDDESTVEELFGPPPDHIRELDSMPDHVPAEVDWGDAAPQWAHAGDDDGPRELVAAGNTGGQSLLSGKLPILVGIAVVALGAVIIISLMGGDAGDDDAAAPAAGAQQTAPEGGQTPAPTDAPPPESDQGDTEVPPQPSPATEARTPDGQQPELPSGWAAPREFETFDTDVADPTVRFSSGGSLWAWSVWSESELISEQTQTEGDFSVTQIARIPVGTAIPAELVITVDCSGDSCRYSTVYNEVTVNLALNGLALTGDYELPPDDGQLEVCEATGRYELEVTDLTVINDRLVPDFIRGTRTLNQECGEYSLREVIEISGRYLFRGSYADQ